MMKRLSKIALLAAAAFMLAGFPACSGDDEDEGEGGNLPTAERKITLYKNGVSQGEKPSVAEALKTVSTTGTDVWEIKLTKGTYTESEQLTYNGSATVKITGETDTAYGSDVIIKGIGSDYTTESGRSMFEIRGSGDTIFENVRMEHIDMMSVYQYTGTDGKEHKSTQREVIGHQSRGTLAAYNCSFISRQDTIRTESKAWFYKCYIEGDVDFLWIEQSTKASKVALYEECELYAVGDRTKKAYFTAPRLPVKNEVGKGLVIWKSRLKADDRLSEVYLGRNPWDEATDSEKGTSYFNDYYENVAVVDSGWSGKALDSRVWSGSGAHGTTNQQFVGFKTCQKFAAPSPNDCGAAVLTPEQVEAEYAGRENILNRYYDIGAGKFKRDTESYWNIAAVITTNKWNVTPDTSSSLADGEAQSTIKKYDIAALALTASSMTAADSNENKALTDGSSDDGVLTWKNLKAAKVAYGTVTQASTEIALKVSEKSVISWQGSSYSKGTISVKDTNGKCLVTGATASTAEDKSLQGFLYTETGETTLSLTFTGTTYINNITIKTLTDETNGIASISLNDKGVTEGSSTELSATVATKYLNDFSYTITWTTSASDIASITPNGTKCTVTGNKVGTATITAKANDKSGTCTFKVNPANAQPETAEYNLKGTVGTPFTSNDGFLKVTANSDNGSHGLVMTNGSNFTLKVRTGAKITLGNCAYDNGYQIEITNTSGTVLSTLSISAGDKSNDNTSTSFDYSDTATDILTFTWKESSGQNYLHYVNVKYE